MNVTGHGIWRRVAMVTRLSLVAARSRHSLPAQRLDAKSAFRLNKTSPHNANSAPKHAIP